MTSDELNESEWENLEQSAWHDVSAVSSEKQIDFILRSFPPTTSSVQIHTWGFDPRRFTGIVRGKSLLINQ